MVSDSELIRKCKQGSQKYQAMLYEKFAPVLMGICIRYTRNMEDAQDLLHDSFVKIFTNIDSCDENGNLLGWTRKIAVNTCINAYYKKKREEGTVEAEEVAETTGDVRIQQSDFLTQELLLRLVSELPDGYRTVFNLFEIDGYSHHEIAEMTGSSYSTVRSQLFKAKRALKKRIETLLGEEIKDHIVTTDE
ncbi:MAG: RNA polymerase sigma factor [Bacteroidales bacterium]|jgi:RNA polymerase sigma-70 factor (ECF subfamily)|nr:RNA polymerase sigma factor [Bacteroidales bacterium]